MTKYIISELRNIFTKPLAGGFLFNELKALENFWRHHKYGLLSFLLLYLSAFLLFTTWLWLPILVFNLFTTFPVAFLVFNYTSILNRPIKFIWYSFFELMAYTQKDLNIHDTSSVETVADKSTKN